MQQSDFYIDHAGLKFTGLWTWIIALPLTDWQSLFGAMASFFSCAAAFVGFIASIMLAREVRRKARAREMRDNLHQARDLDESERGTLQ